eukprot:COSAG01_NODE_4267_length_5196_cov_45.387875_3_plen_165_part_00
MQKWSKGKVKDKAANLVLFDEEVYAKLYKEVPKFKLITPSIISDRLKVRVMPLVLLASILRYLLRLNKNCNADKWQPGETRHQRAYGQGIDPDGHQTRGARNLYQSHERLRVVTRTSSCGGSDTYFLMRGQYSEYSSVVRPHCVFDLQAAQMLQAAPCRLPIAK